MEYLWISCKKGAKSSPSRADRSAVFRENSKWWTKIHTRLTWVSRVKKIIQKFYWLITFFGFNWGQICLATLVKPQNCTKMLRTLTFVVQFAYFSIRPKQFLFFRATFEQLLLIQKATFDCFWATFKQLFEELRKRFGKSRATCGKP